MMHNDRLRKLYGSASRLTEEQINAAPKAWDKRMEERAEASRAQLAQAGKAKVAAIVKARPVVPAAEEVPTVKAAPVERVASSQPATDAPNVALALVLLDAAADLILDRKLRALLDAARAVLS
jgi:sRNA-binding protein